ncbi:hypothetical protein JAO78_016645, partial [Alishewanella sp. 16-MA]
LSSSTKSHGDKFVRNEFGLPQAGREAMQAKNGLLNATSAALRLACVSVRREALQRKKAYPLG